MRSHLVGSIALSLLGQALAWGNGASAWTNEKISTCARERRAAGVPWLTANNASYVCSDAQWDAFYDPAFSIAYFSINDGVTAPAAAACPNPDHSIKCVIFASWGQVAGGPDACTDTCSTEMKSGSESCCAEACTGSSGFRVDSDAHCSNNKWLGESDSSEGHCDCAPDCYDCVHGPDEDSDAEEDLTTPAPAPAPLGSYVDNSFCDCRNGLDVASDYAPCWDSCLDCLGDDGTVNYMPDDVAASCVGKSACYVKVEHGKKSDDWYHCSSLAEASCVKSSSGSGSSDEKAKAKGVFLCGPTDTVV
jgi:hypothetical protein